jgi:hypothetical protein
MFYHQYGLSYKVSGPHLSYFFPSCPLSLRVLPPFMSIDEAAPVLLYLLVDFLSFVGAVFDVILTVSKFR